MIFGHKEEFAVEASIVPEGANIGFGRIVIWIHGQAVGDGTDGCDIPFVLESFVEPLLISPATCQALLPSNEAPQIIDHLHRLRYADTASGFTDTDEKLCRFRRFMIPSAYDIEGFDQFFIVVLRTASVHCRIIWRNKEARVTSERLVSETAYRRALLGCYDWLSKRTSVNLPTFVWLRMPGELKDEVRRRVYARDPSTLNAENADKLLEAVLAEIAGDK